MKMSNMENKNNSIYVSPNIRVVNVNTESIICVSVDYDGQIESISEEDW